MRILVLTPTFLPMVGGAEILLLEVYRRLAQRHQVCLLTIDKGLSPGDLDQMINFRVIRYRDRLSLMKLRGHRLTGGVVPPFSLSAVAATRRVVADFRPDVMNAHFLKHTGLAAAVAQKHLGIPCVLTFSGRDVPGPGVPWFWKYYSRWVSRQVSDVTYITDYCRRAIFGSRAPRSGHVIAAGVDLQRYRTDLDATFIRQRLGLSLDTPVLFAMQRLAPEKRVDIIIRAMPRILLDHPECVLVIGGKGKSRTRLASLVNRLELERAVHFAGYIPDSELPSYYAMCDVFVFHSTFETFGMVLAEAMAAGKPIVSVRSTAIPDVIADGVTGMLVPPLDAQALADKVRFLLDTSSERYRLAHNARAWAEEHFNWDLIASQYEAVLESIAQ